jgi:hypothetical protein
MTDPINLLTFPFVVNLTCIMVESVLGFLLDHLHYGMIPSSLLGVNE